VPLTAYATSDDLAASPWLDDAPPANADRLLFWATFVVAVATNRDPYTDTPSNTDAEVLRDATCAQAASWIASGVDPARLGLSGGAVKSSKILTGEVTYDTTGAGAALLAAARELAPEARAVLLAGQLLWQPVPIGADPADALPQWGQGRRWWPFPEPMSGEFEWPMVESWWS